MFEYLTFTILIIIIILCLNVIMYLSNKSVYETNKSETSISSNDIIKIINLMNLNYVRIDTNAYRFVPSENSLVKYGTLVVSHGMGIINAVGSEKYHIILNSLRKILNLEKLELRVHSYEESEKADSESNSKIKIESNSPLIVQRIYIPDIIEIIRSHNFKELILSVEVNSTEIYFRAGWCKRFFEIFQRLLQNIEMQLETILYDSY